MSNHVCQTCGFPKTRHADSCSERMIRKFVEGNQKFQEYWNTGWIAGFNNNPVPTSDPNFNYIIFSGWESGREARLELGK